MDQTALAPGCYVMGVTPFDRDGSLDEGALRAHVRWMADEEVGFWPASPATGEGGLMSANEEFRVWEIVADETACRFPVVAGNREFPTAAQNIAYAKAAKDRGVDALQLYPPTLGHSFIPTVAMFDRFYDDVLAAVDMPVVLSSNLTTGFEVPPAVFERVLDQHENVIGMFKHHSDQQNIAEFVTRFADRTTVLTMSQRSLFAFPLGATGELDNLQNIAPRLCRGLHDALQRQDTAVASDRYRKIVELLSAIATFSSQHSAPRVVVYKAILGILGRAGGHAREPYCSLGDSELAALERVVKETGLREIEGLD